MNPLLDPLAKPVIGHRGNRAHAPENTLESFAQAIAAGADAIEFDVHLAADGIPVVIHDPTVTRTTGGTGEVARMTLSELQRLDAGARFTRDAGHTFPYRNRGIRIPSFVEVLEAFPDIPLLIEIKNPLAAAGILEAIKSHHARDRCLIDALDSSSLTTFAGESIATGAARSGVARLMADVLLRREISRLPYRALCVPLSYRGLPLPIRRFARIAPLHNCRVHVWTINDPAVAIELWNAGVNGMISDDPGLMLPARSQLFT
ncbi:MAG: glycerophosphodiester phosphodiesterase family protein [Gemmatimonadaceae bacterium]